MRIFGLFRKIGTRIFVSFTILLVGLIVLLSVIGLQFAQKTITANAANEVRVLSIVLSNQVQRQLGRIEESMVSMEDQGLLNIELKSGTPDKKAIEEFLDKRLRMLPLFEDFALYNRQGACVGATSESWYEISAKQKTFFVSGLKAFNFSDIFTSDEGKIQLVSMPVMSGNKPIGVLVGQVNMSSIYDLMDQKLGVSDTTDAFILDSALRFITPGKTGIDRLLESHLVATPLIRHLKDEFWVDQYKNFNGEDVLGTVVKVPGRQWYIVVERDIEEVRRPINNAKKGIFAASVVLMVLLILTTYFLSRSITKPLLALVEGTQRIAQGSFKEELEIPKGIDEVAFLASEIDKMRARIATFQEQMIERLEVSERKRLENERLAAIGTLASTLAHEIRNPLNGMSLLLSRLELSRSGSAQSETVIRDLRGEIARLDRLVSDILDFARPLNLQYDDFDLSPLLEGTIDLYRGQFEQKKIQYSLTFPKGPVKVHADPDRLKQCMVNLLQNAAEACGVGGRIDVQARPEGGLAEVSIRDDGIGLPPEAETRLFDLFFTTKETGTGLGLSTVKKIVNAHGGQISLTAANPGTEVRMTLPLSQI